MSVSLRSRIRPEPPVAGLEYGFPQNVRFSALHRRAPRPGYSPETGRSSVTIANCPWLTCIDHARSRVAGVSSLRALSPVPRQPEPAQIAPRSCTSLVASALAEPVPIHPTETELQSLRAYSKLGDVLRNGRFAEVWCRPGTSRRVSTTAWRHGSRRLHHQRGFGNEWPKREPERRMVVRPAGRLPHHRTELNGRLHRRGLALNALPRVFRLPEPPCPRRAPRWAGVLDYSNT